MEQKLKDNMNKITAKHAEIKKLCEEKQAKKQKACEMKIKAMGDYEKALEHKDHAGMKKTEEMCLDAKKMKLEAKKLGLKMLEIAMEMKKLKIEHCQLMIDWETELMKKKYAMKW